MAGIIIVARNLFRKQYSDRSDMVPLQIEELKPSPGASDQRNVPDWQCRSVQSPFQASRERMNEAHSVSMPARLYYEGQRRPTDKLALSVSFWASDGALDSPLPRAATASRSN